MEVNVTMTEEEYEKFKLFRQMEDKNYLESQIKKNYSLLDLLALKGIVADGKAAVENNPVNNSTVVTVYCSCSRAFEGGISVNIREHFREYQGKKGPHWLRDDELEELGVNLDD